jgi:soluble lytic murein transglycosylase-like protein
MQLMPARATALGVANPFDPTANLDGGVRHLRDLLARYAGNVRLALAAYNAGEDAVRAHGGVPPYPETQEYVRKVLSRYNPLAPPPQPPTRPARSRL